MYWAAGMHLTPTDAVVVAAAVAMLTTLGITVALILGVVILITSALTGEQGIWRRKKTKPKMNCMLKLIKCPVYNCLPDS